MKKILLLLVSLTVVLGLGACSPSQDYQDQINDLEARVDTLEYVIDNLVVVEGINGQRQYILPSGTFESASAIISLDTTQLKDTLDKTKAPPYLLDESEEYISFNDTVSKLKLKYFGEEMISFDTTDIGTQAFIRLKLDKGERPYEEIFVRTAMMIEELSNYEFYLLSCPELYIHLYVMENSVDTQIKITVPLVTLINSFFTITPEGIYLNDYEMEFDGMELDLVKIEQYYNDFINSKTFDGFVLDYK